MIQTSKCRAPPQNSALIALRRADGDGLDTSSNGRIQILLARQLSNRINTLTIVHIAFQTTTKNPVRFDFTRFLDKGTVRFNTGADIFLDKEPHIGALQQFCGALVFRTFQSACHEFVLDYLGGGGFGEGQAQFLHLRNRETRRGHGKDHVGGINKRLYRFNRCSLSSG